jgi:hypothetical protein
VIAYLRAFLAREERDPELENQLTGVGLGSCNWAGSGAMLLNPGLHFVWLEAARAIDFDRGQTVSE